MEEETFGEVRDDWEEKEGCVEEEEFVPREDEDVWGGISDMVGRRGTANSLEYWSRV